MSVVLVVGVGLLLAYANGANDNFKGVATLFGSGTSTYRRALLWATLTTGAGSLAALVLARGLLVAFSGKGLVPAEVLAGTSFPIAVALAAGTTVLLATRFGFPISTTHALIGALLGAGWLASPSGVDLDRLGASFLLPLLLSPFLAVGLAGLLYPPLDRIRRHMGIERETCVCIGPEVVAVVPGSVGREQALRSVSLPALGVGKPATCHVRYRGRLLGIQLGSILDAGHRLSAGGVSFARGLNDTPKIAALLLAAEGLSPGVAILAVGLAIAAGGLLSARRVAETMSHRVTEMNPGQGSVANGVTGLLVVGASHLGLPVSTTHVSCGSLFGIGAVTRRAYWATIGEILLAWVVTLPLAALLGAVSLTVVAQLS